MAFVVTLLTSGCGWRELRSYSEPGGGARLVLEKQRGFLGRGLKITLHSGNKTTTLLELKSATFLYILEVEWLKSAHAVGIFTCGGPPLRLAADTRKLTVIQFDVVRPALDKRLRAKFPVPAYHPDALTWTCLYSGTTEYMNKYGDTLVR